MRRETSKVRQIECLWIAGYGIFKIANMLNSHPSYVREVVKKWGLPNRVAGRIESRPNMWPYIVHWIKNGYSEADIRSGLGYKEL